MSKKILFRVMGYAQIGVGHVYRALNLANGIMQDEVFFMCGQESADLVQKILAGQYPLEIVPTERIEARILELQPDLVINDILDTDKEYVRALKKRGIKVVNFEDLGPGALEADLTINGIYEDSVFESAHVRWGHQFCFLRDEFADARYTPWLNEVKDVLLTFGGFDLNNLTMKMLMAIQGYCAQKGIHIHVVTGPGYPYAQVIKQYIGAHSGKQITFTNHLTSQERIRIMEQTPLAITSNGLTIFELAHMHIPAIVVSHHERENMHNFACPANGFISVGVYEPGISEGKVLQVLQGLCEDETSRRSLYQRMLKFDFLSHKENVMKEIYALVH